MKAVTLNYETRKLEEREIPEPRIARPDDVLLRVREVGICGTDRDLASFRLEFPPFGENYLVLGHECAGEVIETGPSVTGLRAGDTVVPIVRRPCLSRCSWCAIGRRDLCSSGNYTERGIVGAHGYFTELAVDAAADLIPILARLREHAVLIEPLSVVEKAVENALRLHPGRPDNALVFGAGAIGLLAAMALTSRGIAADLCSLEAPNSERGKLAGESGARYLNKPEGPYGIVIEAAGSPEAARSGLRVLAPNGAIVLLGAGTIPEVNGLQLILRNQVIAGSVNASPEHFRKAVEDLERFPESVLRRMVERAPASEFRSTLTGPLRAEPKIVHVLE